MSGRGHVHLQHLQHESFIEQHQSIQIDEAEIRIKFMAFIGAISDNGGLEAYTIHPKAITIMEFIKFVEMLSA